MSSFTDEHNHISIRRMTNGPLPEVPFSFLKNTVLGKKYELSVVFPTQQLSQKLHKAWKGKNSPVNVLSFPLDDYLGEIIITLSQARKEAKKFGRSYKEHFVRLYIHGLVHLKGFDHGPEMDALEEKIWKEYEKRVGSK